MSTIQDISYYRRLLPVNKLDLDTELERQAQVQEQIGRKVAQLATNCQRAKDALAMVEARLTNDMGSFAGHKLTVQQVAAQVQRHPDRAKAWDRFQQTREELEEWEHLLDAWKGRSYTMTNLTHLYGADYFTLTSLSGKERKDDHSDLRHLAAQARSRRRLQDR